MTLNYKLYVHGELHYTLFKELFQSKLKYKGMCEVLEQKFNPFELGEWEGPLSCNNVQWSIDKSWQIQKNVEYHE